MAITGRNLYWADTDVRINSSPILPGQTYNLAGLASDTDYDVYATNLDGSNNESAPSSVFTLTTAEYTPPAADPELNSTDKAAIDNIVNTRQFAVTSPGFLIGITGPRGQYHKAYGTQDLGLGARALTIDDHYRMASITKTFTSHAFLMAKDDGLVSLDDYLEEYIPGVANGASIKMRHLLSMRSGVYDYTSSFGYILGLLLDPGGAYTPNDAINAIKGGSPAFAPDAKYTYNNSNAVLIARVTELVTGRVWKNIIQEDILTPLGLTQTAYPPTDNIPAPRMQEGNELNPDKAWAAGALTTTITDMSKWAQELRDCTLLSPASKTAKYTRYSEMDFGTPPPAKFGYGFFQLGFGRWWGHDGSVAGFLTGVLFDPVSGATLCAATTTASSPFYAVMKDCAQYLYPGSMA